MSEKPATPDADLSAVAALLARLVPSTQQGVLLLALLGGGGGLATVIRDVVVPEPAATQAEVQELEDKVDALTDAVRELGFKIRLHHERPDPSPR